MTKRNIFAFGAVALWCTLYLLQPTAAHAATFTATAPDVTCTTLHIDPPTWATVTFTGSLTGHPGFSITVDYNSTTNATADISSWHLTGEITGTVTATGNFGPLGIHTSLTAQVDMQCGEPATTTTTVAPTTTTTVVVTSTTECQDHTLACAGPPITTTTSTEIGTAITAKQLPFTGGDTVPLSVAAVALTTLGAILVRRSR